MLVLLEDRLVLLEDRLVLLEDSLIMYKVQKKKDKTPKTRVGARRRRREGVS